MERLIYGTNIYMYIYITTTDTDLFQHSYLFKNSIST